MIIDAKNQVRSIGVKILFAWPKGLPKQRGWKQRPYTDFLHL